MPVCGCLGVSLIILHFIALAAIVVATLLGVYRVKGFEGHEVGCISLWGYQENSYAFNQIVFISDLWASCPERLNLFYGAEACSILAILMYLLSLIFNILGCCCRGVEKACILLNFLGAAAAGVVVAIVLDSFYSTRGPSSRFECGPIQNFDRQKYPLNIGFILFAAAAGIGLLNTFLSCCFLRE